MTGFQSNTSWLFNTRVNWIAGTTHFGVAVRSDFQSFARLFVNSIRLNSDASKEYPSITGTVDILK